MTCLRVSLTALSLSVPAPGRLVILTAAKALAGLSFGSLKPKSAATKVWLPSSRMVIVLSVPDGASLTDVTWIVIVLAVGSRSTPPLAVPRSEGRRVGKEGWDVCVALVVG